MTWTLLFYMAGDAGAYFPGAIGDAPVTGDLSRALQADLARLGAAGATAQVAVCVQFDSLRQRQAFRWIAPPAGDTAAPVAIGSINTGEAGSLSDFMAWGATVRPADRYAVILWGHGSGWREEDIYAAYRPAQAATRDASPAKAAMLRRGLFASTAAQIMAIEDDTTRGLCYDDSARDFLDNAELRRALVDGAARMGRGRVDLLALDACLMAMIEVAAELSGAADYLAGAETVLPQASWPWREIIGALQAQPEMGPREAALLCARALPGDGGARAFVDVCQVALDLARAGAAAEAAARWSRAARQARQRDPLFRRALEAARAGALRLTIPREGETDYVDLLDLLRVTWREWDLTEVAGLLAARKTGEELRDATRGLLAAIWPEGAESLVLGRVVDGFGGRDAPGGVSVYLPREGRAWSPLYERLAFAGTGWEEVWG